MTKKLLILIIILIQSFLINAQSEIELVLSTGHTKEITKIDYSPDGKYIITIAKDHVIKIWDSRSGKEVSTLAGHSSDISFTTWSPDNKFFLSFSYVDATINLWDVINGKLVSSKTESWYSSIIYFFWSKKGKLKALNEYGDIYTFKTSLEIKSINKTPFKKVKTTYHQAKLSNNKSMIALISSDCDLEIWTSNMGKRLAKYRGLCFSEFQGRQIVWSQDDLFIFYPGFSIDVKKLVRLKYDEEGEDIQINPKDANALTSFQNVLYISNYANDEKIDSLYSANIEYIKGFVWNLAGDKVLFSAEDTNQIPCTGVFNAANQNIELFVSNTDFCYGSPQAKYFIAEEYYSEKGISVWDLESKTKIFSSKDRIKYGIKIQEPFSFDASYFISSSYDTLIVRDTKSFKAVLKVFDVDFASWSPYHNYLFIKTFDNGVFLYKFGNQIEKDSIGRLTSVNNQIQEASWLQESSSLYLRCSATLYHLNFDKKSLFPVSLYNGMKYSPSGKFYVYFSGFYRNEAVLIDVSSGKKFKKLMGHSKRINNLLMLSKYNNIVISSDDKSTKLFSLKGLDLINSYIGNIPIGVVACNNNSTLLATYFETPFSLGYSHHQPNICIYNLETGNIDQKIKLGKDLENYGANTFFAN